MFKNINVAFEEETWHPADMMYVLHHMNGQSMYVIQCCQPSSFATEMMNAILLTYSHISDRRYFSILQSACVNKNTWQY